MNKKYIGLATTPHDPAIAIVNSEGKIVFAEAAERYLQNKRAWNSPPDDMVRMEKILKKYCHDADELIIATSWTKEFFEQLHSLAKNDEQLKSIYGKDYYYIFKNIISYCNTNAGINLEFQNSKSYPHRKIIKKGYNHHLTHAAAACYGSPYHEAACAVIDGFGENITASFYRYNNGKIALIDDIPPSYASLGEYYGLVCTICGFNPIKGEEWKVMGLAPYGKYDAAIYNILKEIISVNGCVFVAGAKKAKAIQQLMQMTRKYDESPLVKADLAYTGQYYFVELIHVLMSNLHKLYPVDNLIMSGGCALNSASVGSITLNTPFKNSYVYCAPADDGNAVGAALLAYYNENDYDPSVNANIQSPYLGEEVSYDALLKVEKYGGLKSLDVSAENVPKAAAKLLADGKIIGWVQGKAEYGPRALGNRSILADPRSQEIKQRLNDQVKFREEFRPFAPAILHEYGEEYFENYVESPYMERALLFKKIVRDKVPGVVHVDGTGRLQTVKKEWNERYYCLIDEFRMLTGIPIILNTSFNVMGKPIIHSVEDAVAVFFTSGIDVLIIEDKIFVK